MKSDSWNTTEKILFRVLLVFVLVFMFTFSFPHKYIPDPAAFTSPWFQKLADWSNNHAFHISYPYTHQLVSDSTGLYIHTVNVLAIALIVALLWTVLDRRQANYRVLAYWLRVVAAYYLSLQMLMYGFYKVFGWQFYMPEPNTLYTPVGQTTPDLLFWTLMGVSRSYTLFGGLIELSAGCLLLFRRTRLLGALLTTGIMANVVMMNLGFNISVKLYSCYLVLLGIIIIVPEARRLLNFFLLNRTAEPSAWTPAYPARRGLYILLKTLVILVILVDSLAIFIATNNFNDARSERPPLHGAYQVVQFVQDADTLSPAATWKRVFVHRRGYFITEDMQEQFTDYSLAYDTAKHLLELEDYDGNLTLFSYSTSSDSMLVLQGQMAGKQLDIHLKKLDMDSLPLLQPSMHWTID